MAFTNRSLTLVDNSLRRRLTGARVQSSYVQKMARPDLDSQPVTASGGTGMLPGGFASDIQSVGYFGAGTQYRTFDSILPENSEETLIPFYRDIYYYDAIGGSAVDLTSSFPFSDWTLSGIDNKLIAVYSDTLARLNMRTLLPEMLMNYLVDGDFIGTLIYSPELKNFYDIMIHDRLFCQVIPSPFYSMDPVIRAQGSAKLKYFRSVNSKYGEQVMKNYPQHLIRAMESGAVELDPLTTLHLGRRSLADRMSGSTSYLKRLLPIYLLEKTLYRGTLIEFNKRMRATTHIQCLSGDSLVSTDEGLTRIDKLVQHNPDGNPFSVELDLNVKGYDGEARLATHWHYRGNKETVTLTTDSGTEITCTPDHRILTLSDKGTLGWRAAGRMLDQYVCIPVSQPIGEKDSVNLRTYEFGSNYGHDKRILPPVELTPSLGYVLGALSGDGTVSKSSVIFRSIDESCADAFMERLDSVFGTESVKRYAEKDGHWLIEQHSVAVSDYLKQLGLYVKKKGLRSSHHLRRRVPTSILRAGAEVKFAWVAGYLDTDGTVVCKKDHMEIVWTSVSKKLLLALKELLCDLGYLGYFAFDRKTDADLNKYYLRINASVAPALYRRLEPYLADTRKLKEVPDRKALSRLHGIPVTPVLVALNERATKEVPSEVCQVPGKTYLLDDIGESVVPPHPYGETVDKIQRRSILNYEDATGLLQKLLGLASVSSDLTRTLNLSIDGKYKFERVVSVVNSGVKPVYDLSMEEGCYNAFVANSMIVHNCGDDTWEPTDVELEELLRQFQSTEMDPLGAWIVTRQGVNIQDVRQGGDFLKWTDMTETLVPLKLRSLGISEAFLAGDANFSNCLTGDTLIPTTQGLRRIDSFGTGKRGDRQAINVVMDSRYKKETAVSWLYQGYRPTIKVTTETGNSITATGNHPVLVLHQGKTEWKRTDELQVGDTLCVSRNKVTRTAKLKLNIKMPEARKPLPFDESRLNKRGNRVGMNKKSHQAFDPGTITPPKYMTPDLAYWMALFISEGCVYLDKHSLPEGRAHRLDFGNTDKHMVKHFAQLTKDLFGIDSVRVQSTPVEELGPLATKDWHSTYILNRRLIDWLEAAGVYVTPGKVNGKNPSYVKEVPWSILQADEESQRAFLAGYAECDGSIGKRTVWFSKSTLLITQLRAILNSHGYQPTTWGKGGTNLSLTREDSAAFWDLASGYLTSTKLPAAEAGKYSKTDGVPSLFWTQLIQQRKVRSTRHGAYYKADDGTEVCWARNSSPTASSNSAPWGFSLKDTRKFNYQYYDEGRYDGFLIFLKALSPSAHQQLVALMKTRYRYSEVISLAENGHQHVYDISMKPGVEPAFVANGLVVHNTEAALTVFMENIDNLRNYVTTRTFGYKLFPLVAIANGFYKKGVKPKKDQSLRELLFNVNNQKDLEIPKLIWNKDLTAKEGSSKIEMLEKLAEKGMPVALRTWAAAANLDISSLMSDLSEEGEDFAKLLAEYKAQVKKVQGGDTEEDDGGGFGRFASVTSPKPLRRKGVLAREFDDPKPHVLGRTGKPKAVLNEHQHMKRENEAILKAALSLRDPNRRQVVKRRITNRFGQIPRIL